MKPRGCCATPAPQIPVTTLVPDGAPTCPQVSPAPSPAPRTSAAPSIPSVPGGALAGVGGAHAGLAACWSLTRVGAIVARAQPGVLSGVCGHRRDFRGGNVNLGFTRSDHPGAGITAGPQHLRATPTTAAAPRLQLLRKPLYFGRFWAKRAQHSFERRWRPRWGLAPWVGTRAGSGGGRWCSPGAGAIRAARA